MMTAASPRNTLRYDPELCTGCGMCRAVCPHAVFGWGDGPAELVDPDACMECGACQENCPTGALLVDSGVGCAYAMFKAALRGEREPTCGDGADRPCSPECR